MRLTRRGRIVLVVALVMVSLGWFWLGTRAAGQAAVEGAVTGQAGSSWVEVHESDTVRPGDTAGLR
ncbi:hypothetical protein GBF35_38460 [Nonomuraea phyllanthi]|uniref:hypothetical protein n=1 Tax=Nonomuraea phyllanthi TaxID=2219224 RepID=UPI001293155E|nr:hypothetical protein [Nonomuraea phyllanthi]QFY11685.1 hypothetical protein GBF35_38460 [Nonomuraea phyllanthi]